MLTLIRYPGQSIIFEYGNTLELLYYKQRFNYYIFKVIVNGIQKEIIEFIDDILTEFEDDNIIFKVRIEDKGIGVKARKITIWCPNFVNIRRKEIPYRPRNIK